ncbi:MAG: glycoside hydrolase family 97 protein [Bacteroidaceae bacterium]|nr:glycoside hydrolase family 97 protein [Bacteroidaceae bacterium]
MKQLSIFLLFFLLLATSCSQRGATTLFSPNEETQLVFSLTEKGIPTYAITSGKQHLILPSVLGFTTRDSINLSQYFRIVDVLHSTTDETWSQPWGENKTIRNHYNEMAVVLQDSIATQLTLRFRLFNDGVGFRYEYQVNGVDSLQLMNELTTFQIADGDQSWSTPANYDTYELDYTKQPVSAVKSANTPFTFTTSTGLYASIHEAALTDFAGMTLKSTAPSTLEADLVPWPDGVKVRIAGNHFQTPWRTIQIGHKAVDLINSSILLNLNEPCQFATTDWIRPMKYVGVWWGMHLGIESWTMDNRHGATTVNAKRYIDFAQANNIEGVLFEGWNNGWESWGSRQDFDFTQPYADFDMDEVTRYAKEKNIQIIGHHETGGNIPNYEAQMDKAYEWSTKYGIHSIKTGYAGGFKGGYYHHSQYAVRHYRKVVETAAKYHITIDAHEPIKPTGIRRTYPNMMTREGAKGMEWNAWSEGNSPTYLEVLPFTRLLAGPMDYTPGTFDILFDNSRNSPLHKKWNGLDKGNSRVHTTLAKQLANWVILYSPLQMASDRIENYKGHPAFQFFRDFKADCDWSRALQGEPGEFVAVVRRAGEQYFLGATTNETPRTLRIPLSFLKKETNYQARIYADGADADWKENPLSYTITEQHVNASDTLTIKMAAGGGQAISFVPVSIK